MSKHTPGPWAVADVGEVVVCATGRTLCDVYSSPTTGDEQADADARLIAAGPDLFAVCMDIIEADASGIRCPMRVVEAARMAVAKARGET